MKISLFLSSILQKHKCSFESRRRKFPITVLNTLHLNKWWNLQMLCFFLPVINYNIYLSSFHCACEIKALKSKMRNEIVLFNYQNIFVGVDLRQVRGDVIHFFSNIYILDINILIKPIPAATHSNAVTIRTARVPMYLCWLVWSMILR
jgi:hypothetical protein